MRLQKYIANQGICSRRKAEELIKAGKIEVNSEIAKLGTNIDIEKDKIKINNETIKQRNNKTIYIALNKPVGYICSTTNKQGKSVLDLISEKDRKKIGRVYPVGRLDKDSEGLVLLTNDGELTNLLTHPRYEHEKEYEITITETLKRSDTETLGKGMFIDGEKVGGIEIKNIKKSPYELSLTGRQNKNCIVTIILKEGKNRQIRKMFGRLGYNLISLKRTKIGKLKLDNLKLGEYKFVDKEKIV